MRPPVTGASPQIARSTVDLPEPDFADQPEGFCSCTEADVADGLDAFERVPEDGHRDGRSISTVDVSDRRIISAHAGFAVEHRQRRRPPPIFGRQLSRPRV